MSKELGDLVKSARKKKGISRAELIDIFKDTPHPLTLNIISGIERGKTKQPTYWLLQRLAYVLEIDEQKLLKLAGYIKDDN